MKEEVKRLAPETATLRELYLKSGNICAFPQCSHPIVDENGVYVAQLCHIEAANVGGPRFNKDQSNDDRRQANNLLLMCHRHHKVTDDIDEYDIESLQKMKLKHESKFEHVLDNLANEVTDLALETKPILPDTLRLLIDLDLFGSEYEQEYLDELKSLIKILQLLTPKTRKVFALILNRMDPINWNFSMIVCDLFTNLEPYELKKHLHILETYGLIYDDEADLYSDRSLRLGKLSKLTPHPLCLLFKDIYETGLVSLEQMIIDLDFLDLSNTLVEQRSKI